MSGEGIPPLTGLLHELAEGLQSTGTYLGAARRLNNRDASVPAATADPIAKAADELLRAQAAFHLLRAELSRLESGDELTPDESSEGAAKRADMPLTSFRHDIAEKM